MTELMVMVERVVRPVRAAGSRKLKMREELLAHLTAIYEEERAKLGDDALALQRAARRFGEPAELTKELQATVPRVEGVFSTSMNKTSWEWRVARWFLPRPNEGVVRHSARLAAVFAGYFLAMIGLTAGLQFASGVTWVPYEINAATVAVVTAHAFVSAALFVGFLHAVARRPSVQSMLAVVACGAAILAIGPLLPATLAALEPGNPLWGSEPFLANGRLPRNVLIGTFYLALAAAAFRVTFTQKRRTLDWMNLEIDG